MLNKGFAPGTGRDSKRPFLGVSLTATIAALAALAIAAPVASADEPWGFEKVTPSGKGGGALQNTDFFQVAPDGDSLLYSTTAPFESVPADTSLLMNMYHARRGATSWSSRPLAPKFTLAEAPGALQFVIGTSPNLRWALIGTPDALTPDASVDGYNLYRMDTHSGELTHVSSNPARASSISGYNGTFGGTAVKYFANDGKTIVWVGRAGEAPGQTSAALVRWTEGEGPELFLQLPDGTPVTSARLGNDAINGPATRDSIPRRQDGDLRLGFSLSGSSGAAYVQDADGTRVISRSRLTGVPEFNAGADVHAVSDNGRFTLFTTGNSNARLTDDTPVGATHVLYLYDADEDSLTYVGERSGVNDSVIQMAHNGRSVAFQSTKALTPEAIAGRKNIYVWRDGTIKLAAVPDADGSASNVARFHRLLSENGRYLVFTDDSASLAASFGVDNANPSCVSPGGAVGRCTQVYRFDADAPAAEALACASCRTDGQRPAGPSGDPATSHIGELLINAHAMRMVVDDGTVFFTSADDLLPEDSNGQHDAYAWRDGELRLLSRGKLGMRSRFVDASADGSTVLISTNDPITSDDTDSSFDLYVTGEEAGFPATPPTPDPQAPCSGADCREPVTTPPLLPDLGSVGFDGNGNVTLDPDRVPASVGVSRLRSVSGSAARLRVRVPSAGRVSVRGRLVKRKRVSVAKAGSYWLRIVLRPKAKKALKKERKLKVNARVSFKAKDGQSASKVVSVTFKKPKAKRAGSGKGGR